jgi:hypothetical protein
VKRLGLALALLVGSVVAIVACGQGIGDRCQIDTDCADNSAGVVCNKATNTCQDTNGGGIDASVPDAPTDAPPDAPPDAPRDAPLDI